MIKRCLDWSLFGLLIVASMSMIAGIYLYMFHENPPAVLMSPIPVDKAVYRRGEPVFGTVEYCRYTKVPVTVYISFVDSLVYTVPPHVTTGMPIGCGTIYSKLVDVPVSFPLGTYYLIGKNGYKVNFLVTRYVEWYTVPFEVIE